MIHDACYELTERGFAQLAQIEDRHGTIGYGLHFLEDDYILVAKEYSHQGLASFIATLVEKYADDSYFIFYNDNTERFTVFDGQYLKSKADDSSGESKKGHCSWKELPLDAGAELDAFIRGDESPTPLAGENERLQSFA